MALVLEGWLEKKGSFVKSWKRRWFVLTEDKLQYFVEETQNTLKGGVDILASSEVLSRDGSTHEFKFGVQTGTKILEISADCEETRLLWMDTLHKTINNRRCDHSSGAIPTGKGLSNLLVKKVTKMEADTPMNRALKNQAAQTSRKQQRQNVSKKSTDSMNLEPTNESSHTTSVRPKKKMAHRTVRHHSMHVGGGTGRKLSADGEAHDGTEGDEEPPRESEGDEGVDDDVEEGVPEPPPILPAGWEQVVTEDGSVYYYHKVTRVSR